MLALLAAMCGCTNSVTEPSPNSSRRRHAPRLLSEIRSVAYAQYLFDTSFDLTNNFGEPAHLRYDGAGCSCYGVSRDGRTLKSGDEFVVDDGERVRLQLEIPVPTARGEKEFTARFTWLRSGQPPAPHDFSLTVPVYEDVVVQPPVLSCGYRPGQPPPPMVFEVVHYSRRRDAAETPPVVDAWPDGLSSIGWRKGRVLEVAPGLWEAIWRTEVAANLPAGFREQWHQSVALRCGGEGSAPIHVAVLVEPRFGIRAPGDVPFGAIPAGEPRRRRVLLTAADQLPFRVTHIATDDERCRATFKSQEPSRRQWIEVEALLNSDHPLSTRIVCRTDHPESPRIEFLVTAQCSPNALVEAAGDE